MGAGRGLGVRQEGTTQSLLLTRKEMREMPFLGTSRWQRGGARAGEHAWTGSSWRAGSLRCSRTQSWVQLPGEARSKDSGGAG